MEYKKLDREDIESFGFGNYTPPKEYDHTWTKDIYTLTAWFNRNVPILRVMKYHLMIFHGNVKNRNELKKILEQLEVIEIVPPKTTIDERINQLKNRIVFIEELRRRNREPNEINNRSLFYDGRCNRMINVLRGQVQSLQWVVL